MDTVVHHQQSSLIITNNTSNTSYYFAGRGLQLYKGYCPIVFGVTQLFFLAFCFIIYILHLSGLRLGFVIFLCLSIANVVLADMVTDSVFDEEKYNYAEMVGFDKYSSRLYVRVIAPMMYMFNVLFGTVLFSFGWLCGQTQRENQAAALSRGPVWKFLSGISGILFILVFPLSNYVSHAIARNSNDCSGVPILVAFALALGPILPLCPYVSGEGRSWKEQEICRIRQTMMRYFLACLLVFVIFTIPYFDVPFDYSPIYEFLRRIFLFLQIIIMPYYVRYSTFAQLPGLIAPLKREGGGRLPPYEYYDSFEIITRKGILFSILRIIAGRRQPIEYTPARESVELSRISRKGAVYSENRRSEWFMMNNTVTRGYYLDGRTLYLYKGYCPIIFGFVQLLFLTFCFLISYLHLSGLRLGFVLILCLSLANVVLADIVTDSVFDTEKYNYGEVIGMDRYSARLYFRVIAPMMHYFNALITFFLYELMKFLDAAGQKCIQKTKTGRLLGNIVSKFMGMVFLFIFPISHYASYLLAPHHTEQAIFITIFLLIILPFSLVLPFWVKKKEMTLKEVTIYGRRRVLTRFFLIVFFLLAALSAPYSDLPFDYSPIYEVVRRISLVLQMLLIAYYVRYITFAQLPNFLNLKKFEDLPRPVEVPYEENFDVITRNGLLFCILRILAERENDEAKPETAELNKIELLPLEKCNLTS